MLVLSPISHDVPRISRFLMVKSRECELTHWTRMVPADSHLFFAHEMNALDFWLEAMITQAILWLYLLFLKIYEGNF
jgi:hypothetical protein